MNKMDLIACIKQIVKERGVEEIAKPTFWGLLCDYGAFEEESNEAAIKHILKLWLGNGKMEKIIRMSANDSQWKIDVSDIIHQTETEGFKKEVASYLLHKLLLGIGFVDSAFDWEKEFMPKKTISVTQSTKQQKIDDNWDKTQRQQQREKKETEKVAKRAKLRQEKSRNEVLLKTALEKKKDGFWLKDDEERAYQEYLKRKETRSKVFWGITIGMAALLLVSVIVYCYCRIVDSGNELMWGTLSLVSIVLGTITSIIAGILDDDTNVGEVFIGITLLMAIIFIVSLVVICYGWIVGSGHKAIWNLLSLISLCTAIPSYILGLVFDD